MHTLSNNYRDVEVWNLDAWSGERGPFLVTQVGVAPGDDQMRESLFVLRPDGTWADLSYYLALGRPEALDEAVFESLPQVMDLLGRLDVQPVVANLPVSDAGLREYLAGANRQTFLARARQWVEQYRERHRRDAG